MGIRMLLILKEKVMGPPEKELLVIAQNRDWFNAWCMDNNVNPVNVEYVVDVRQLWSRDSRKTKVIILGSCNGELIGTAKALFEDVDDTLSR